MVLLTKKPVPPPPRYKNADYTRDGVVTAHELLVYLQHRVS